MQKNAASTRKAAASDRFSTEYNVENTNIRSYLPICLDLHNRQVVVAGGGAVAFRRTEALVQAGARVVVVSPFFIDEFLTLRSITLCHRKFRATDLQGAFIGIAATDNSFLNKKIAQMCKDRGILCNAVDDAESSDFIFPATIKNSALMISVTTSGASPALAKRLCDEFVGQIPPTFDLYLNFLRTARAWLKSHAETAEQRKQIAQWLASAEGYAYFLNVSREQQIEWLESLLHDKAQP